MLKLDNVTISYKNVPTVQNFNLDMKEGQIVSLVGESGSGKTTVIRAGGLWHIYYYWRNYSFRKNF